MLIAVVSDAHGARRRMDALLDALPPIDALCFLGDMDKDAEYLAHGVAEKQPQAAFHAVAGNNDPLSRLPKTETLAFEGMRVLLTHGHLFRGIRSSRVTLAEQAARLGCQLALYGHTHIQKEETIAGVWLINPGALKQGEWALLTIMADNAEVSFASLDAAP